MVCQALAPRTTNWSTKKPSLPNAMLGRLFFRTLTKVVWHLMATNGMCSLSLAEWHSMTKKACILQTMPRCEEGRPKVKGGLGDRQHQTRLMGGVTSQKEERLNLKETTFQKLQPPPQISPLTGGGLGVGNTLLGLWVRPPNKKRKAYTFSKAFPKIADPISRVLF